MTAPAARLRMPLAHAAEVVLMDELAITRRAWPSLKDDAYTLQVYAEAISFASSSEIRAAFYVARAAAKDWPPRPNDVRDVMNAQQRARLAQERSSRDCEPTAPAMPPDLMRMHGAVARLSYGQYFPIALRRGVVTEQSGCPDKDRPGYAALWTEYEAGRVPSVAAAVAILVGHGADPQPLLTHAQKPLHFAVKPEPTPQP